MNKKKKTSPYPDPLATVEEKNNPDYGLKYAKYISDQWFDGGIIGASGKHATRREWIRNRRLYAKGKQDQQRYKDVVAREQEDLAFLNLDWRPTNFAGKFVRVVANGTNEENYSINVAALDRLAGAERDGIKAQLTKNMRAKGLHEDAKNLLGIDVSPKGYVPEDEEDLSMFTGIKQRLKCEISEEILINYVFKTNNWHNVKAKVDEDLTAAGIGVCKAVTDPLNGIRLKYIDPEFFVHSYVREKDFTDMKYAGDIEPTTISDLKRNTGYSDAKLREIAKSYAPKNRDSGIRDFSTAPMTALMEYKIDVLHFSFETSKTLVYKKRKTKHGNFYVEKEEGYNPKKRADYERADKTYNTWYEGSYVIGTDSIYNYRECENMITDEGDLALSDYVVRAPDLYENELHSFVEDIEPTLDQMHYTLLKLQHLVAEIRPNGANIDLDMLAEIESATKGGGKMQWQEILSLFQTKGITFSKRTNMGEDGVKDSSAVQTTANGVPANLPHLLSILQDQYQRVRDITGINPFRDGSQGERALVGVQQLAFLQSNVATSHIVNASLDITKVMSERISSRLTDIFSQPHLRQLYERAVGKENMDVVESLKDRSLREYGFAIQLKPTQDAIAELNEDLSLAMSDKSISVDDKMEAKELAQINIKMAREFIKYARAKKMKELREDEAMRAQAKAKADAQAAQIAEESRRQSAQNQAQVNVWEHRQKAKIDTMSDQQELNINMPLEQMKMKNELTKEKIRAGVSDGKVKYTEEEKMKRQNKNNTDHSKMIEQRNEDSGAIDFEGNQSFKDLIQSMSNN